MEEINDKLYEKLYDNVNEGESIYEFIEELGISPSKQMSCLFHPDPTPSLSVSDDKGMWKCFSCGAGGRYVEFTHTYATKILNKKVSKKNFLEDCLSKNKNWQKKYGVVTLKTSLKFSVKSLEYLFKIKEEIGNHRKVLATSENTELTAKEKKYKVIKDFNKLKDVNEIMEYLTKIQREEIEF